MTVYHGSTVIVSAPLVGVGRQNLDFGPGFYVTDLRQQAISWAIRPLNAGKTKILNIYEIDLDGIATGSYNYKKFVAYDTEWLDFVINCRQGVPHDFDIVEGPMADDQIWDYIEDFVAGNISREAFWALARFKHPTHQIVFCTPAALKCITYKDYFAI